MRSVNIFGKGKLCLLTSLVAVLVCVGTWWFPSASAQTGSKETSGEKTGGEKPKKLSNAQKKILELISFEVVNPPPSAPGSVVTYTIKGKLKPGFHTYPISKIAPGQGAITLISYEGSKNLKPLWPITEKTTKFHFNTQLKEWSLEFQEDFTWSQEVYIQPETKPGEETLVAKLNLQVCDENGCYGPANFPDPVKIKIMVTDAAAVAVTPEVKNKLQITEPKPQEIPIPKELLSGTKDSPQSNPPSTTQKKNDNKPPSSQETPGSSTTKKPRTSTLDSNLFGLLGSAFLGAFLMLLTPCVFPMIPITVNFFLKQSEKKHHNSLATALVYSGTIIVLLTCVMLAFGNLVVYLANDGIFNLVLGLVLIIFALSLFGMYELELPSGLARFTSAREGQGGYVGAVFMALTFTITSFTCTGPFLGAMLAPVAGIKPPFIHLLLAALVYSTTFAAPFFVLALFPTLLKALPKSGGWLNTIKVTMGFLEIAAALKFLSITDNEFNPGNPKLFNYDTVLCAWIALAIACGFYLLGLFRLPHDDRVEHIGAMRVMFACLFFGLALYMFPLLRGEKPEGIIGDGLIAFLPQSFKEPSGNANGKGSELAWHRDYQEAWKEATREGKLIFIDFTGVNCQNCRYNEKAIFPNPQVVSNLKNYVRVQLYVDTVPNPNLSAAEAKKQAQVHEKWRDAYAEATNPTYLIFQPDTKETFNEEGIIKGVVIDKREGQIFDVNNFIDFLKKPLDAKAALKTKDNQISWHKDYPSVWKVATQENRLIFINFTGIYSSNCRYNEVNVLAKPPISTQLQNYACVELYTDTVPDEKLSAKEASNLAKKYAGWRDELSESGHPCYVIFRPDSQAPFKYTGEPNGTVLDSRAGLIQDLGDFQAFLEKAQ